MKYIGMGYMPCNGYVPCQPAHLDSEAQEERIEGAMPCHNYQGGWRQGYCITIMIKMIKKEANSRHD